MAQHFEVPLDAELALLDPSQTITETQVDEDDIFQCGRCKKQFTSLPVFLSHKSSCRVVPQNVVQQVESVQTSCVGSIATVQVNPASAAVSVAANSSHAYSMPHSLGSVSVPSAPTSVVSGSPLAFSQNVILTDDLMNFTSIDAASLQGSTLQTLQVSTDLAGNPVLSQVTGPLTGGPLTPGKPQAVVSLPSANSAFSSQQITITAQQLQDAVNSQQLSNIVTVNTGNNSNTFSLPMVRSSPTKLASVQTKRENSASGALTAVPPGTSLIAIDPNMGQNSVVTLTSQSMGSDASMGGHVKSRMPRMKAEEPLADVDSAQSKKKLKCQYCDKEFTKNFDLQQHVRSHTGEKPFQCIVCGRAFAQKSNVKKHMQTHKVWPGGTSQTLPEQPDPEPVTETDTQQVEVEVTRTDAAAQMMSIGQDKNKKITIDNSFCCQFCGHRFKSYFQLKTHMVEHKDQQVYKCIVKECGQQYKELDHFLEHTKAHSKDMVYRCHMCNKQFNSLLELGVHQYSHSLYPNQGSKAGPKYFRCAKCNNKYATPEALQHHTETVTHNYPCKFCKKTFPCEKYLRRHLVVHGSAEFVCTICSKSFKTEHYLKMHLLTHSSDRPYACDVCSAAFNRKDKLNRHRLIHETTKRYKCPFRNHTGCMKEFNRQDKLKSHIISHSGLKPYKCDRYGCNKSFSRKPHLREHLRIHAKDYRFVCENCHRGFLREKLYNAHVQVCTNHRKPDKDGDNPGDSVESKVGFRGRKRPGRPKRKMITVTSERKAPPLLKRGRTRMVRVPARYQDGADEREMFDDLQEVKSGRERDEINMAAAAAAAETMMLTGRVTVTEDGQVVSEPDNLPEPITKVELVDTSQRNELDEDAAEREVTADDIVVIAAAGGADDGQTYSEDGKMDDMEEQYGGEQPISFVHDGFVYNPAEAAGAGGEMSGTISLEALQKGGFLPAGTNITTLVVQGNQIIAQGSDGETTAIANLIPTSSDDGSIYVSDSATCSLAAVSSASSVTYVTSTDQMVVEYDGGYQQQGVYQGQDAGGGESYHQVAQVYNDSEVTGEVTGDNSVVLNHPSTIEEYVRQNYQMEGDPMMQPPQGDS